MVLDADLNTNKLVSIIIVSYNSKADLTRALPSFLNQSYTNKEIIVVDNGSTDGTPEFIRTDYPDVKLVEAKANLGYGEGNNIGAKYAKGEYLIIVNPDTLVKPDWLKELVTPLIKNVKISITAPKILLYDHDDQINTCGNFSHYTGLDFCRGLNESKTEFDKIEEISAFSGCCFATRSTVFKELGGFDKDFFMYLEDTDLSWRALIEGHKILYVPTSIIYHDYSLTMKPWKIYHIEKNRLLMILKNYKLTTLLLIAPSLVVTEIIILLYSFSKGLSYGFNKMLSYYWIIKNINNIMNKRREINKKRKIMDIELFRSLEWGLPFGQLVSNKYLQTCLDATINNIYKIDYLYITLLVTRD